MEADYGKSATLAKQLLCRQQPLLQLFKFAVHMNANGLERTGRGVFLVAWPMAQRLAHDGGQFPGG